jgi:hypothetical protein
LDADIGALRGLATRETPEQEAARLEAERLMAVAGDEMHEILNKPVVKKAFADLGKDYYNAFLKADTQAARDDAWAKGRALLDLAKELRSVLDRGRMAKHARRNRAAAKEARERRNKRQGLDALGKEK